MRPYLVALVSSLSLVMCVSPTPEDTVITITPTSPPSIPASLDQPTAGDGVLSAQLRVETSQKVLDGLEVARLGLYGGGIRRRVKCVSNTDITIQPLGAVLTTVAGKLNALVHNTATTVNLSAGLVANTRYWVYASNVAGAVTFTKSTTAPDAGLRYKTGDAAYLYVSTFITDSSSNIVLYSQSDNVYWYNNNSSFDALVLLSAGNSTSPTAVATNFSVPAEASSLCINALLNMTSAGRYARIRGVGGGASNEPLTMVDNGAVAYNSQVTFAQVGGTGFEYFVSNSATQLTVLTCGFTL